MLAFLGHEDRTYDGFTADDQRRRLAGLIVLLVREELEIAIAGVVRILARAGHPQEHQIAHGALGAGRGGTNSEAAGSVG